MSKKNHGSHKNYNATPHKRKKFSSPDMIKMQPLTKNQTILFNIYRKYPKKNFFLFGSAGTGKTFMSFYLALEEILENINRYDRLIIVRSAVPARDIGYLPGEQAEKMAAYEAPYASIIDEFCEYENAYEDMKDAGIIEFHSTSFLRGTTFNNAIIVVDECQNLSFEELNTIMTRVGLDSKIIFCGDIRQNDLNKNKYDKTGFEKFKEIIDNMRDWFDVLEFDHSDIVRSPLVKAYIITSENVDKLVPAAEGIKNV